MSNLYRLCFRYSDKGTIGILALLLWVAGSLCSANAATTQTAIFAGGCFWCMQSDFDKVPGVISTEAGYTGDTKPTNPSYEFVSSGKSNYVEAIKVVFDPQKISYKNLLTVFWHNVDPTRNDGQFCDKGHQYRPEIFYTTHAQKNTARQSKTALEKSGQIKAPILVAISVAGSFYPAEEYHQEYYKKNPIRYRFYRYQCGRDKRLKALWGDAAGH